MDHFSCEANATFLKSVHARYCARFLNFGGFSAEGEIGFTILRQMGQFLGSYFCAVASGGLNISHTIVDVQEDGALVL